MSQPPPPPPFPVPEAARSPVTVHPLSQAPASAPLTAAAVFATPPPPPHSQPQMRAVTPKVFPVSPPNQSLDAMADAFLSADGTLAQPKLRPLPLPQTTTDLERVRALVVRRAWGDVLSILHALLRGPTSHYTAIYTALVTGQPEPVASLDTLRDDAVELMLLQCHAWIKMRRYAELGHELRQWKFLNDNDHPWLPPSIFVTAAAAWMYVPVDLGGGFRQAAEALHQLRQRYENENNVAAVVAVEYQLANVACRQKSWRMALQALDRLAARLPAASHVFSQKHYPPMAASVQPLWQAVGQCEVWSRQGRIFLQMGALEAAATLFQQARQLWQTSVQLLLPDLSPEIQQHPWIVRQIPAQVLHTNFGLLAFSYRRYEQASEDFRQALQVLNGPWSVDGSYERNDWVNDWDGLLPPQHKESLYAETMNNLGVAALYAVRRIWGLFVLCIWFAWKDIVLIIFTHTHSLQLNAIFTQCRLHDAIQVLESLIRTDPTCFLTERMALKYVIRMARTTSSCRLETNVKLTVLFALFGSLCTLYELSADTAVANRKKRTLQLIAKRFFLHDIGPESFRISP